MFAIDDLKEILLWQQVKETPPGYREAPEHRRE